MQTHDWSQFLLRIPINASLQTIYDAWSSQEALESWFLRKAEFKGPDGRTKDIKARIEINDVYEWMWHGWPDEIIERGTIIQANGKDLIKFSFGKAGNVTVTVNEEQGKNVLQLQQDEIPTDENGQVNYHIGCTKGWVFYLANLKSILEGGIDLRNREVELKDVISS